MAHPDWNPKVWDPTDSTEKEEVEDGEKVLVDPVPQDTDEEQLPRPVWRQLTTVSLCLPSC